MNNIVCFDVETTGLNPVDDYIIQLAMVKIDENFNEIDSRNWYIKPCRKYTISDGAKETHGITEEFIEANGVYLKDIAEDIILFIQGCDYLTYNGNSFDVKFLYKDLSLVGYDFPLNDKVFYDAYLLYKKYHPSTLAAVYKQYVGKELENSHDAFSDVKATIDVFKGIAAEQCVQPNEWVDVEECNLLSPEGSIKRCNGNDIVFALGKYRDEEFCKVFVNDPNYIKWFGEKVATPYTKKLLNNYVKSRLKK